MLTYRGAAKYTLFGRLPGGGTFRVTVEDAEDSATCRGRGRLRKRRQ
jgi:hypothetical protein